MSAYQRTRNAPYSNVWMQVDEARMPVDNAPIMSDQQFVKALANGRVKAGELYEDSRGRVFRIAWDGEKFYRVPERAERLA